MSDRWPLALITAIRTELTGNTRQDLISWAQRITRNPPSKQELSRAKLVLDIADKKL